MANQIVTLSNGKDIPIVNPNGAVSIIARLPGGIYNVPTGIPEPWLTVVRGAGIDTSTGVAVDGAGNVYVSGHTRSSGSGNYDLLLLKFNKLGELLWQRTIGNAGDEYSGRLALDSSGNVYITGNSTPSAFGGYDLFLAKFSPTGVVLWQRILGSAGTESGLSVHVDSSGGVIVCGTHDDTGAAGQDMLVVKYDSSGSKLWHVIIGGSNSDSGSGVVSDSLGNLYVAGSTGSMGAAADLLLVKFSPAGAVLWQRRLTTAAHEAAVAVAINSAGDVYVCGYSTAVGFGGSINILLAKFDSSGALVWKKLLGGAANSQATPYDITVDAQGDLYLSGNYQASGGLNDSFLIKCDSTGTVLWQNLLRAVNPDNATAVTLDAAGAPIMVGRVIQPGSAAGESDVFAAKLKADGTGHGIYGPMTYQRAFLSSGAAPQVLANSGPSLKVITLSHAASNLVARVSSFTSNTYSQS